MRVALLPTGKAELLGLPTALKRLFPSHEFESLPKIHPDVPFDGFTTSRLPVRIPAADPNETKLIQEAAAALVPGRRGVPFNFVFILDDLEVENMDQPGMVVEVMRTAAKKHLTRLEETTSSGFVHKVTKALRTRASFHLAVPMLESWFFADPDGAARAGVPDDRLPPRLTAGRDPEDFLTDDANYCMDDGSECTAWNSLPPRRRKNNRPEWIRKGEKCPRHPKAYLSWLCRSAEETRRCTTYNVQRGKEALEGMAWQRALQEEQHCQFLRAFLEDLADALQASATIPPGAVAPQTAYHLLIENHVLRNI